MGDPPLHRTEHLFVDARESTLVLRVRVPLATIAYIVTEVSFVQSAIIWILDKVIPGRRTTQNQAKPRHRK